MDTVYQIVCIYANGTKFTDTTVYANRSDALNLANKMNLDKTDNGDTWVVVDVRIQY